MAFILSSIGEICLRKKPTTNCSCLFSNFSIIILIYELKIISSLRSFFCHLTGNSHFIDVETDWWNIIGVWVVSNLFILWQLLMNRFLFQLNLDILNIPRYFYLYKGDSVEFDLFPWEKLDAYDKTGLFVFTK